MKRTIITLSVAFCAFIVLNGYGWKDGDESTHNVAGAPAGYANDPANGSKTCKTCHTNPNGPFTGGSITSTVPPLGYTAGSTYTVTTSISSPSVTKFGFSASPQDPAGNLLGTLANLGTETTINGTGGKYITHTASGVTGAGSKSWSFEWTAPATGLGPVTFYAAFLVTNNSSSSSGDTTYITTLAIPEDPTAVPVLSFAQQIQVFPNPSNGEFQIQLATGIWQLASSQKQEAIIEIYNLFGEKVFEKDNGQWLMVRQKDGLSQSGANGNTSTINHQPLTINLDAPSGIYFLKMKGENISELKKIIISR